MQINDYFDLASLAYVVLFPTAVYVGKHYHPNIVEEIARAVTKRVELIGIISLPSIIIVAFMLGFELHWSFFGAILLMLSTTLVVIAFEGQESNVIR